MLVAKPRNQKWRLISRTCCPPPAAALRAAWGACGAPLAGGSSVYGCGCARYTTGALWRAPGEHDYAVVASTRERVASIFTKTLGVPSAASIRSDVTVPGALAAQLRVAAERRPRLSSRRRGAEGTGLPPSATHRSALRSIDRRSKSLQIRESCWRRCRSQPRRQQLPLLSNAPRSDAGVLGPPWTTKAPPGARRPVRWHPLRTAAGAPTTAVAPPLMEGRSAPLLPRRRWEGHWWWPGRPSAAARRAASKGRD